MKVRDVIRLLEDDGWALVATKGSHRQFKHPTKRGRVTVAGKLADDLHPGPPSNYSAWSSDLPGCVATGATLEEAEQEMRRAIAFHLAGLAEDGAEIPSPSGPGVTSSGRR
jgi:predicted RNA binding protein YcfA (HicA-like mRNA interferase family)